MGNVTFKEPFSSSQLEEFKETFSLFEIEKAGKESGRIKAEDLPIVMRALGQYASDDEFRRMTAGKKNFNFQEFLDLMEAQAKETAKVLTYNNLEKEFIEAFKIFDRDGDGHVDALELRYMMQNHGSMRLTDAEVEEMMSDADINGDGKLNFEEFIQLMMAPVDDAAAFNSKSSTATGLGGSSWSQQPGTTWGSSSGSWAPQETAAELPQEPAAQNDSLPEEFEFMAFKRQVHTAASDGNDAQLRALFETASEDDLLKLISSYKFGRATYLHCAAEGGHEAAVSLIVTRAPDQLTLLNARDGRGCTALHIAAEHGHVEVARALLRHAPDNSILFTVDNGEMTALHLAAASGRIDMVGALLEQRGMLTTADEEGTAEASTTETPVDPAQVAQQAAAEQKAEESFSQSSNQISLFLLSKDARGRLALHIAAELGHVHVARALLTHAPDSIPALLSAVDDNESTAFHLAAASGSLDTLHAFLELKSYRAFLLNAVDKRHRNAQCCAREAGHESVAAALHEMGEMDDDDQEALANECKSAGFSVNECMTAGFSAVECIAAGYSSEEFGATIDRAG